jgi:hypothetical protein
MVITSIGRETEYKHSDTHCGRYSLQVDSYKHGDGAKLRVSRTKSYVTSNELNAVCTNETTDTHGGGGDDDDDDEAVKQQGRVGKYKVTKKWELLKCVVAALGNRDLELQTTSPFSNHGSVERSTARCRHTIIQFL